MNKEVAIIGAGLTGLTLSIYLAKRGYKVNLYEQRSDPRVAHYKSNGQGRSMSLDLSMRGLTALSEIGLNQTILSQAVPMKHRIIHLSNNELVHLQYDTTGTHNINAISRAKLHHCLINESEKYSLIKIHFNQQLVDVDQYIIKDEVKQVSYQIFPPLLLGCDGVNSTIRKSIENKRNDFFQIKRFGHQYKELILPNSNEPILEFEAMHMWPRENSMLVAQPNDDGSFICALLLPAEGEYSFPSLLSRTKENIHLFFKNQFADIQSFIPHLSDQLINNPLGSLVTIRKGTWSLNNKILLLGDSVHGMVPFLGQGMNACLEDCYLLNQYLRKFNDNWNLTISEFEKNRKADTDAISAMSLENYPELTNPNWRDYILHREIEDYLSKNFSDIFVSYHNLVCFSLLPYQYANKIRSLQKDLINKISSVINHIKEITKDKIQGEIDEYQLKLKTLN